MAYTWKIFAPGQTEIPNGSAATIDAAISDATTAAFNWEHFPAGLEIYDESGSVVAGGQWDASGNYTAGVPGPEPAQKFTVAIMNTDGTYMYSSGFVFQSLDAARSDLESYRGSIPAGDTKYKYTISDRAGIVDSGYVTSTAYVPNETDFAIHIQDNNTLTDIVFSDYIYTTMAAAKSALLKEKSRLKNENPETGRYIWDIRKNGVVVLDGIWIWPLTDGGTGAGAGGGSPWIGLIVIGIIIVGILFLLPKLKESPMVPKIPDIKVGE